MSSGQRQKVLIARALAQELEVFLLDEPTTTLDIRYQLEVLAHGLLIPQPFPVKFSRTGYFGEGGDGL